MKDIKAKIGMGGLVIAALGVLSIILYFFNFKIKLLAWVDLWGDTMGWVIRIALIIVGAALFYFLGQEEVEVEHV
jgi:hypothetical protein